MKYERITYVIGGEARVMETKFESKETMQKAVDRLAELEDKIENGELSCNDNLYKTAFDLILQDVYETRLQADTMSCSSCPYMEEIFDECQNQGLYEDCKRQWQKYYLEQAEARLKELQGE